jgi:hypothetical protein
LGGEVVKGSSVSTPQEIAQKSIPDTGANRPQDISEARIEDMRGRMTQFLRLAAITHDRHMAGSLRAWASEIESDIDRMKLGHAPALPRTFAE